MAYAGAAAGIDEETGSRQHSSGEESLRGIYKW